MEAIERFSVQFSHGTENDFVPFISSGSVHSIAADQILLGVPNSKTDVTDIGCAAGESRELAGSRAILEVLEHHHFNQFVTGQLEMVAVEGNISSETQLLTKWLFDQLRILDIRASLHHGAYWFAVCSCSDFDGGRRTESHGTGHGLIDAVNSALKETTLSWRNMIELEKRGTSIKDMSEREKRKIRGYRGASKLVEWPKNTQKSKKMEGAYVLDLNTLLLIASAELDCDLCLIDLTHRKIGVPVVRCNTVHQNHLPGHFPIPSLG
jgi:ribosomal protein S12 methylthiotransferase accessory factor YcaO